MAAVLQPNHEWPAHQSLLQFNRSSLYPLKIIKIKSLLDARYRVRTRNECSQFVSLVHIMHREDNKMWDRLQFKRCVLILMIEDVISSLEQMTEWAFRWGSFLFSSAPTATTTTINRVQMLLSKRTSAPCAQRIDIYMGISGGVCLLSSAVDNNGKCG